MFMSGRTDSSIELALPCDYVKNLRNQKEARAHSARALISNGNRAKRPCPPGGRTGSNDRLRPAFGHRSEDCANAYTKRIVAQNDAQVQMTCALQPAHQKIEHFANLKLLELANTVSVS